MRTASLTAAIVGLTMCGFTTGAATSSDTPPAKITAPPLVAINPGDLGTARVTWTGSDFKYTYSAGLNVFREYDPDPAVILLRMQSAKAGEYSITCIACSKEGKLTDFTTISVKVGTAPQPPPDDITPAQGKLAVLVIEEPAPRTPQSARVLTDKAMWDEVKALGHTWRIIPSTDPLAKSKGYTQVADTVGYPALLLVDSTGRLLNGRKLPATANDLLNVVKEYSR